MKKNEETDYDIEINVVQNHWSSSIFNQLINMRFKTWLVIRILGRIHHEVCGSLTWIQQILIILVIITLSLKKGRKKNIQKLS